MLYHFELQELHHKQSILIMWLDHIYDIMVTVDKKVDKKQ